MKCFLIYLLAINIIAFAFAYADKRKAIKGKWRISEGTLFGLAILGGCVGLYIGFLKFRHKTKHMRFMIGVPVIFAVQVFSALKFFKVI